LSSKPIEAVIDFSNSDGMLMGNSKFKDVRKTIPGYQTEFIMHTMASGNKPKFSRNIKWSIKPQDREKK